jgi:hypothetical protein
MSLHTRCLSVLLFGAAVAATASAQSSFTFQISQSASNFVWTGTSTLGPIVGNPSNQFQLVGETSLNLALQSGPNTVATGEFTSGEASVVPDIHGRVNNPIPFLPPLATIDITGLVISPSSSVFTVAPGGAFTTDLTLTALAGTMTITVIGQSPQSTDLTGQSTTPTSATGALNLVGGALELVLPVNSTFAFTDPGSGASGSVTLVGTLVASYELVRSVCAGDGSGTACPCGNNGPSDRGCLNSTGVGGRLQGIGLPSVTSDAFVLASDSLPATSTALYFQGNQLVKGGAGVVFGDGLRCATNSVVRLGTKTSVAGTSSYPSAGDPAISVAGNIPASGGTRAYQVWYRNSAAFCNPEGFNLTNAALVTWIP